MRNIIAILGTHGSGKTTLAKKILTSDGENFKEYHSDFGRYTLSEKGNFAAIGSYSNKCGGGDTIKTTDYMYLLIEFLLEKYPKATIIVESIMLSHLQNKPLKFFLKQKYEKGIDVSFCFLYVDIEISYKRVCERNGRMPNVKNIQNKYSRTLKKYAKLKSLNEFNCFHIDTTTKNKEEVFEEFKRLFYGK